VAEAARLPDIIDVAPAFTLAEVAALNARFAGVDTATMLRDLLTGELAGRTAVVSSFGTESGVLLHLVASIDKTVPVIFVNTQKMFGETLAYRAPRPDRPARPSPRSVPPRRARRDEPALEFRPRRLLRNPQGRAAPRRARPVRRMAVGAQGLPGQDPERPPAF
jgi:phosphoadenosine phosphosulfate reductase